MEQSIRNKTTVFKSTKIEDSTTLLNWTKNRFSYGILADLVKAVKQKHKDKIME